MANLLRKIKYASDSTSHHLRADTTFPHYSSQDTSRLDEFRKKLARKASTFSLRSKTRRGGVKSSDPRSRAHTLAAFENESGAYNAEQNPSEPALIGTDLFEADSAPYPPPIKSYSSTTFSKFRLRRATTPRRSPPKAATRKREAECELIRLQQAERLLQGYLQYYQDQKQGITCGKMASEQAAPPVTYERLRQLTTEACDSTLSSIKAYAHTSTESWNTAIINTILAALVTESTPTTGDAQPNYKFIVNSTIIQHAPVASGATDDAVRSAGRRGMHSASGAFWNNERDGMWSFKYEAAEAKGLDVVIGIVWIWVG